MGPRKRAKPNPQSETERPPESPKSKPRIESQTESPQSTHTLTKAEIVKDAQKESSPGRYEATVSTKSCLHEPMPFADLSQLPPDTSTKWYGSWPRGFKSNPITQVARESISATNDVASTLLASAASKVTQSHDSSLQSPALRRLSRSIKNSTTSLPLSATNTKINIPSSSSGITSPLLTPNSEPSQPSASKRDAAETLVPGKRHPEPSQHDDVDAQASLTTVTEVGKNSEALEVAVRDTPKWNSWFFKPSVAIIHQSAVQADAPTKVESDRNDLTERQSPIDSSKPSQVLSDVSSPSSANITKPSIQTDPKSWSWLGLWKDAATQPERNAIVADSGSSKESIKNSKPQDPTSAAEKSSKSDLLDTATELPPPTFSKPTGWAFWSRDRSPDESSGQTVNAGKLAIAELPSQSRPGSVAIADKPKIVPKSRKRERPQSSNIPSEINSTDLVKGQSVTGKTSSTTVIDASITSAGKSDFVKKRDPPNLVLPSFKNTYKAVSKPSFLQQISRLLQYAQLPDTKHVNILEQPLRIKNALAIVRTHQGTLVILITATDVSQGVHGYFPTPLIRSVIGQPTGTSIRFANSAAVAIQKWTQNQGYQCEVEKIALEGEGKVAERIDLLWKLLLNWKEKIRKADFIMIACHSQGVPVAMMLVAKLIEYGCVNGTRIGVCALAGINLGPFAYYKSRWIGGSAGELFDFARFDSQVSKDYEAALEVTLKFGVRVVYIGSIDDQLVSLEVSNKFQSNNFLLQASPD